MLFDHESIAIRTQSIDLLEVFSRGRKMHKARNSPI
jgi:hypothetical protein